MGMMSIHLNLKNGRHNSNNNMLSIMLNRDTLQEVLHQLLPIQTLLRLHPLLENYISYASYTPVYTFLCLSSSKCNLR